MTDYSDISDIDVNAHLKQVIATALRDLVGHALENTCSEALLKESFELLQVDVTITIDVTITKYTVVKVKVLDERYLTLFECVSDM